MPWLHNEDKKRRPAIDGAQLQDVWEACHAVRVHFAGMLNSITGIQTSIARIDARLEGIAAELAVLRGHRSASDMSNVSSLEDHRVPH